MPRSPRPRQRFMLLIFGAMIGTVLTPSLALGQAACSPDTTMQAQLKADVTLWAMADSTDTESTQKRQNAQIPHVTNSTSVSLVTNSGTCGQLRTALAALLDNGVPASSLSVVAIQVDTVFVVVDPSQSAGGDGEWLGMGIFGSAYQLIESVLY